MRPPEWYKAAYYNPISGGYFAYPYQTNTPTVCAAPGATPNTANCNHAVGQLTNVGAYTGSASPYGAYDMGGNAFQWSEQIESGSYRGIQGGDWGDPAGLLAAGDNQVGNSQDFAGFDNGDFLGFRVAMIPEPGTALLVMSGLMGLTVPRRHARSASLGERASQ